MARRRTRKQPIELRTQPASKQPMALRKGREIAIPIARTPRMQTKPGMIT